MPGQGSPGEPTARRGALPDSQRVAARLRRGSAWRGTRADHAMTARTLGRRRPGRSTPDVGRWPRAEHPPQRSALALTQAQAWEKWRRRTVRRALSALSQARDYLMPEGPAPGRAWRDTMD